MKYCSQCGASNADDAKFCESCGAVWADGGVAPAAPVVAPPVPGAPVPAPVSGGSNAKMLIVLGVAALVFLGAVMVGWTLFFKPMSTSDYEDKVSESIIASADALTETSDVFNDYDVEYDEEIGDENLKMLRDAIDGGIKGVKDARNDIARLRAPKEYKSADERLVKSYDGLLAGLGMFKDMLGDIKASDTDEDLNDKFEGETEAMQKEFERAGRDMQKALEDMDLYDSLAEDLPNLF